MNFKLPPPRDELAGCLWLPRILAKARWLLRGQLPPEYAARFCHPSGVDNQFLLHLGLNRDDIMLLAEVPDNQVAEAFLKKINGELERVRHWNEVAVNLGRPGFPLAERLPIALVTTYKHLSGQNQHFATVFEVVEADEGIQNSLTQAAA